MKYKIYAMSFCILVVLALTGCQLAQNSADGAADEDRLVGLFLTTEYLDLFDFEGYMNDNLKSFQGGEITINGDSQKYQGRLYATMVSRTLTNEETGETSQTEEYVFPSDGIPYFSATVPAAENHDSYRASISDPAISDGHVNYKLGDDGDSVTLTGTVYVSPVNIARTYYFNPVYQSADGSVYATTGNGFMVNTEAYSEGSVYSQTLDATTTVTEGGKTKTDSTSITLSISVMFAQEKIVVLQMSEESAVLLRNEYAPDTMPESISTESETDYLIVETHKRDDTGHIKISRATYSSDTENIETFFVREDGICVKHWTRMIWSE